MLCAVVGIYVAHVQSAGVLLKVGAQAPDFSGKAGDKSVTLSQIASGESVVLVFYPMDDTAVCTSQLCALRDSYAELSARHCTVLGINPAGADSHTRFANKYNFPFPLVTDTGGRIAEEYGCSGLFGLNRRTVYVVGKDRKVLFAERGKPAVSEILSALR